MDFFLKLLEDDAVNVDLVEMCVNKILEKYPDKKVSKEFLVKFIHFLPARELRIIQVYLEGLKHIEEDYSEEESSELFTSSEVELFLYSSEESSTSDKSEERSDLLSILQKPLQSDRDDHGSEVEYDDDWEEPVQHQSKEMLDLELDNIFNYCSRGCGKYLYKGGFGISCHDFGMPCCTIR